MTIDNYDPQDQGDFSRVLFEDLGTSEVAFRVTGSGSPLLLLHGWPLSGMTFRSIIPALSACFTCYVLDFPGAGETRWTDETDFGFKGQAETVKAFADALGLKSYSLLAHDTGATIARQLALIDPKRIEKIVLMGTEIPYHRPPWIPLLQRLSYLPGSDGRLRRSMKSDKFLRSSMGFGGCFFDTDLLKGEFHSLFIEPLIRSRRQRTGQIRRLRGIDWALVDSLAENHAQIQAPVLLIWGAEDSVFPVERAKEMIDQLKHCRGMEIIPRAKLFVHEEQPALVTHSCLKFLLE